MTGSWIAESKRTKIAKEPAGIVRTEHLERRTDTSLRMGGASFRRVATITTTQRQYPRIAPVASQNGVTERQEQVSRARVIPPRRQIGVVRKWQKLTYVSVCLADRLAQAMPAELFVKLEEATRIKSTRRIIKPPFKVQSYLRRAWRWNKVQLTILSNALA